MKKSFFIIINEIPKDIDLKGLDSKIFGKVTEITSRATGSERANLAFVRLNGPDVVHYHKEAEETYYCIEGAGKIFLAGGIYDFRQGTRVIIRPGTLHAVRPLKNELISFYCVASPAFRLDDVFEDPRGRNW